MKSIPRLDKLVIGELIGPYVFGVALFTVLIVAASYLYSLSDFLVKGAPPILVGELSLLYIPGVLVKTFAMAMLLAGLLAFGRLSNDSEIIALKAAGIGMMRIILPVAVFAFAVSVLALVVDETVVPWSASASISIVAAISKQLNPDEMHPQSQPIMKDGKLIGMVDAQNVDTARGILTNATVTVYGPDGSNAWYLYAKRLVFNPDQFSKTGGGWGVEGGAVLLAGDGSSRAVLKDKAWPPGVPKPTFNIADILASQVKNLDVLSMAQIKKEIQQLRNNPRVEKGQIANLEYGYWNKIALPLAVLVYGLLGAPLGIRHTRSSTAGGFALAIGIIFGYVFLGNLLNVYAMGGAIPPWVASFTPLAIGLVAAVLIIRGRNR